MGDVRRRQICNGAARVIAQRGFAGTTMRAVANQAGVSTGMLNHYYPNRAEMLASTLTFVSERLHRFVRPRQLRRTRRVRNVSKRSLGQ